MSSIEGRTLKGLPSIRNFVKVFYKKEIFQKYSSECRPLGGLKSKENFVIERRF